MKIYTIQYKNHSADDINEICVYAKSKEEAYDKAVFEELFGSVYSAWVSSVEYSNGKEHLFNNFEGKPY